MNGLALPFAWVGLEKILEVEQEFIEVSSFFGTKVSLVANNVDEVWNLAFGVEYFHCVEFFVVSSVLCWPKI